MTSSCSGHIIPDVKCSISPLNSSNVLPITLCWFYCIRFKMWKGWLKYGSPKFKFEEIIVLYKRKSIWRSAECVKLYQLCNTFQATSESQHYTHVTMSPMASEITSLGIVYSTVYSGADQRKHQSSASLAFVRRIHWMWTIFVDQITSYKMAGEISRNLAIFCV